MSRDEAIKALLETKDEGEQAERIERIEAKLDLILSVITVQQKAACAAVGITPQAIRNKVLRGETEILQRDGSSLNFLTLSAVGNLKRRKGQKRSKPAQIETKIET